MGEFDFRGSFEKAKRGTMETDMDEKERELREKYVV